MAGYRIRGAKLVCRAGFVSNLDQDGYFLDGDIIEFAESEAAAIKAGEVEEVGGQCFRLGNGGSTLTPVARGSWEAK